MPNVERRVIQRQDHRKANAAGSQARWTDVLVRSSFANTSGHRAAIAVMMLAVLISVVHAAGSAGSRERVGGVLAATPLPIRMGRAVARSDLLQVTQREQTLAVAKLAAGHSPLFCGGRRKYAALTFDDGPTAHSPSLLRLLRRHHIRATYFVTGANARRFPHVVSRFARAGAIGNHSWSHPLFTRLDATAVENELRSTQTELKSRADRSWQPFSMVRPPYGGIDRRVDSVIRRQRLAEILWSADSEDALGRDWREVGRRAVSGLGPGAVILMHDGPDVTIPALRRRILPAIRRKRLHMVTIPELLVINPPGRKRLENGPRGCSHSGEVNVSGYFDKNVSR